MTLDTVESPAQNGLKSATQFLKQFFSSRVAEAEARAVSTPLSTQKRQQSSSLPSVRQLLPETYKFKNPLSQWSMISPLLGRAP